MPGDLLSANFRCKFEDILTPSQQQQAIDSLQDYIQEVQYGTDDQRRDLGVIEEWDDDREVIAAKCNAVLEKCYWQLVMFLKSSKPSLIASAEPYLRFLLESPCVQSDSTHAVEVLALLHLAAALAAPLPADFAHDPSPLGLLTASSPVASCQSDLPDSHTHAGDASAHPSPVETRDAEALALFARAFSLYESASRSRGSSPSPRPAPATPSEMCSGALGLDVAPQPASPIIAPASPTFAFAVPTSPRASLDVPRAGHRLTAICGRNGKLPAKTELWARASYVALLRRLAHSFSESKHSAAHVREAERQLALMRAYLRENPYALPHDRSESFLRDLERDFGIVLNDDASGASTSAEDVLGLHAPLVRQPSPLRLSSGMSIEMPAPTAYPSLPPSSSSSSCSSTSSSSSASPQTPYSPLSPANTFIQHLHALPEHSVVDVGKAASAMEGLSLGLHTQHGARS